MNLRAVAWDLKDIKLGVVLFHPMAMSVICGFDSSMSWFHCTQRAAETALETLTTLRCDLFTRYDFPVETSVFSVILC